MTDYNKWINGDCCDCNDNQITCSARTAACECDNILAELDRLSTNDEILQDEIDAIASGASAITSGEVQTMIDESISGKVDTTTFDAYTAYTGNELNGKATKSQIVSINNNLDNIAGELFRYENETDAALAQKASTGSVSTLETNVALFEARTAGQIGELSESTARALSGKQDTLIAGDNITISGNVISATDTTYSAGRAISINNNTVALDLPVYNGSGDTSVSIGSSNGTLQGENKISGLYSVGIGWGLVSQNQAETSIGSFNKSRYEYKGTYGSSGKTSFSVGNGSNDGKRHNAFEIRENGDIYIAKTSDIIDSASAPTGHNYYDVPMIKLQDALGQTDLSDYYTKEEVNTIIAASEPSLSGYVTTSELIQYITNLQQQINSLIAEISGCCGSTGETQYRWVIETGENDYWCSGTTKMSMEKEQSSNDGLTWTDTGNERSGSTVLETNCTNCGYEPVYGTKLIAHFNNGNTQTIMCNGEWEDGFIDRPDYNALETGASGLTSAEIGSCPTAIAGYGFSGCTNLSAVTIPNNVTSIGAWSFMGCRSLTAITIPSGVTSVNQCAFAYCSGLTSVTVEATTPPSAGGTLFLNGNANLVIYVPSASVNAYKAANGWSTYASKIQGI